MFLSPENCDDYLPLMRSWDSAHLSSDDWYYILKDYNSKYTQRMLNKLTNKYENVPLYPFYLYLSELLKIYKQKKLSES